MADTETVIASIAGALTIIAQVAQGVYSKRKGKEREPRQGRMEDKLDKLVATVNANSEKIDASTQKIEALDTKMDTIQTHFEERHKTLGARVERIDRAQRKSGAPFDDAPSDGKP